MYRILAVFSLALAFILPLTSPAAADNCSDSKRAEQHKKLRAPATSSDYTANISCDISLKPNEVITRQINVVGSQANGITIDCNGATIDGRGTPAEKWEQIKIKSRLVKDSKGRCVRDSTGRYCQMDRPKNITVRECKIFGRVTVGVHLFKIDTEVDDPSLGFPQVSYNSDFRDAARRNAPRDIHLEELVITTHQQVALYVYPGVRGTHLIDSRLYGTSKEVAVYLDRESYKNVLRNNHFGVDTEREIIAIDGSSGNQIINNYFVYTKNGGIYLFRNCGEPPAPKESYDPGYGTIRHNTSSQNIIINNRFNNGTWTGSNPNIWIGSRNGLTFKSWCDTDLKADGTPWPWGSSKSDYDHASRNVVMQNQIYNRNVSDMIKIGRPETDQNNVIYKNEKVSSGTVHAAGCYLPTSVGKPLLEHGKTANVMEESNASAQCHVKGCDDGNLFTDRSCAALGVALDCQVTDDSSGCHSSAYCPVVWGGRPGVVIGAKAGCNLEYGSVKDGELDDVKLGRIKVIRESDNPDGSYCYVGGSGVSEDWTQIQVPQSSSTVDFGCWEYEKINGGDCHVRGTLYCGY